MEQDLGEESSVHLTSKSTDIPKVLDVKPIRCVPVFPSFAPGASSISGPQASQHSGKSSTADGIVPDDDGYSDSMNISEQHNNGFGMVVEDESNPERQMGRPRKKTKKVQLDESSSKLDEGLVVNSICALLKLLDLDISRKATGDKNLVDRIVLAYDLLRRRFAQHEETMEVVRGSRRSDLTAGKLLMNKGVRTNETKRIGHVPGINVGDIFFFRMELCILGLHAPSMAGIDYITLKVSNDEEPIAVSIVSSGGYENIGDDGDVLIYTGQGGVRSDGQMCDQKLERGNLALEKSIHRGNEVRVIRGLKDSTSSTGKIYIYDGLYKTQESWSEKNKSGFNNFKYKLVRISGQSEAFTLWKTIQQWKAGFKRDGVILPDLTSGEETKPISLVNDVDDEKGPDFFIYIPSLRYNKPFIQPKPFWGCHCLGGCQSGDANCPCIQRNEGYLPYNSLGVILSYNSLVHECGPTCACPPSCRNRMTQSGLKVHLEVFKTKERGWGLRSLDPIRAGGFICEYAGDIIDASNTEEFESEDEDNYLFDTTRICEPLEGAQDDHNWSPKAPFSLVISAKNRGNVARFMNHSCSANVYWQPILRESNSEAYLHIAFFAMRHIPPMQELTFDYGMVQADEAKVKKKTCLCGSMKCRGYFY